MSNSVAHARVLGGSKGSSNVTCGLLVLVAGLTNDKAGEYGDEASAAW